MKINFINFGFFEKLPVKKALNCATNSLPFDIAEHSVSINLVDEQEIQNLNLKFRNIDKVTDVLSFPMLDFQNGISEANGADRACLGDIAICKNVAKKQAEEYGHSYKRELAFLALHGFLHLLGYDHEVEGQESEMFDLQEKILNDCNLMR